MLDDEEKLAKGGSLRKKGVLERLAAGVDDIVIIGRLLRRNRWWRR